MSPDDGTSLEDLVDRFSAAVFAQQQVDAAHYDQQYFASDWREGDNRYDLETRRRIEDRNPALVKEVFAPQKVLDLGCGPGFLMELLRELGVEADGIDYSPASLELAPAGVRDRMIIGEVTEPHVPERSYDLVISREVFEHLTVLQVRQAVHQLCRASSRYVYVTTRFHPEPASLLDFTTQFEVDPSHITLLTKELLRLLILLEGFERRADLEERMDWGGKGRVLVYERAGAAADSTERPVKDELAVETRLMEKTITVQARKIKDLGAEIKELRREAAERAGMADVQQSLDSIVRLLAVDPEELPYPQRLTAHRFGISSQGEEDGVIWALLRAAGFGERRFVELGCGDNGGNTGFLATEAGWTGLMVDGDGDHVTAMRARLRGTLTQVVHAWVERDGIDDLIRRHGLDGEIDVLSIDLDGNDYWILEAIEACRPRILVVEYNTAFGPDARVTVPYDPAFARDAGGGASGLYYGASLNAWAHLARRKGYRLVAGENVNAFFLRDDVAPEIPEAAVEEVYKAYAKETGLVAQLGGSVFEALSSAGLELVEISD
jgi:SAM-dependent methyltransferase